MSDLLLCIGEHLVKITILEENSLQSEEDRIIQLAKWVHQKTEYVRSAAMYRSACEQGISIPLFKCKKTVMQCPIYQLDKVWPVP